MHKANLSVSGIIFLLFALVHLYRIYAPFPITFGSVNVPEAASYVGLVIFGLLAIWDLCGCCSRSCCCGGSCSCKKIDKRIDDR